MLRLGIIGHISVRSKQWRLVMALLVVTFALVIANATTIRHDGTTCKPSNVVWLLAPLVFGLFTYVTVQVVRLRAVLSVPIIKWLSISIVISYIGLWVSVVSNSATPDISEDIIDATRCVDSPITAGIAAFVIYRLRAQRARVLTAQLQYAAPPESKDNNNIDSSAYDDGSRDNDVSKPDMNVAERGNHLVKVRDATDIVHALRRQSRNGAPPSVPSARPRSRRVSTSNTKRASRSAAAGQSLVQHLQQQSKQSSHSNDKIVEDM
eukprot:TRINITY_DN67063_c1_g1_i3.p1 TRINITY_DN67063_c1_g1~~TRINITY_DN67063_c1_g1_i3.p1  ORF type:complete len:265 (+),score=91.70 TRINITY_DN67063_c1_g1_i3:665-1459(+)